MNKYKLRESVYFNIGYPKYFNYRYFKNFNVYDFL